MNGWELLRHAEAQTGVVMAGRRQSGSEHAQEVEPGQARMSTWTSEHAQEVERGEARMSNWMWTVSQER